MEKTKKLQDNKYIIWKKEGELLSALLDRLREEQGIDDEIPLTYAGRLDPLACGKVLILAGEKCKEKNKYLKLDKKYFFCFALGFKTDTGDLLGIPKSCDKFDFGKLNSLKNISKKIKGSWSMQYPIFSSKPVVSRKTGEKKPLFYFANTGRVSEVDIPSKTVYIYKLNLKHTDTLSGKEFSNLVRESLQKLNLKSENDFRLAEIKKAWSKLFESLQDNANIPIVCGETLSSSGLYVRALVERVAKELGGCAVATLIKREEIGRVYKLGPFVFFKKID